MMYEKVLVGISEEGDPGPLLDLAVRSTASGGHVSLLSVIAVRAEDSHGHRIEAARDRLEGYAATLRSSGLQADVATQVTVGQAGAELARRYDESDAGLLIIGLRSRSRVGKALLGSDAQTVLIMTAKPVLCQRLQ
jgi:nucleotide-binding universal stress UspA family protein